MKSDMAEIFYINSLCLKEVEVQYLNSDLCQTAECLTFLHPVTCVRVELVATTDLQSLLEMPATDEIHMEDRNHDLSRTMAYKTR